MRDYLVIERPLAPPFVLLELRDNALRSTLVVDVGELIFDESHLLLKILRVSSEESSDVILSQILCDIKTQTTFALVQVALSVLLEKELASS